MSRASKSPLADELPVLMKAGRVRWVCVPFFTVDRGIEGKSGNWTIFQLGWNQNDVLRCAGEWFCQTRWTN